MSQLSHGVLNLLCIHKEFLLRPIHMEQLIESADHMKGYGTADGS